MKKLAGKVREWFRDKDKGNTIDGLETMAFILSYATIVVMAIVYGLFVIISDCFNLKVSSVIIGTIATIVIILITCNMFVMNFIHSFVYKYEDIQDLKFLSDCVDHMKRGVIQEWLKMDITARQGQLEALQHAKHKSKEDMSLDKTQKKKNWNEIGVSI